MGASNLSLITFRVTLWLISMSLVALFLVLLGGRIIIGEANIIAYSHFDGGKRAIYLADVTRGHRYQLRLPFDNACCPSWSPDGSVIAFIVFRSNNSEIVTMNADGSGIRPLARTSVFNSFPLQWSPDGQQIGFASVGVNDWSFFFLDVDDGELHRLHENITFNILPVLAPNDARAAYVGIEQGRPEITLVHMHDGQRQRLKTNVFTSLPLRWSPDGQKIAYLSLRNGFWGLEYVDLQTEAFHVLVNEGVAQGSLPSWSPDGLSIVYMSQDGDQRYLSVVSLKDKQVRRITMVPASAINPIWSPDGRQIAFITLGASGRSIFIVDIQSSNLQHLEQLNTQMITVDPYAIGSRLLTNLTDENPYIAWMP